ncbi:MAG: YraN family protein [Prevotellaceae bacterium]|nr:YraN family protein [Prevotellaceae bacterium]
MATHNALGRAGEDAAAAYLEREGYTIRHRNWRKNHLELDIVAMKEGELVVVEVKTRSDNACKEPHEAVDSRKIRRLVIAADAYMKHYALDATVRFDIITAVGGEGGFHIEHIPSAFYPPMFG